MNNRKRVNRETVQELQPDWWSHERLIVIILFLTTALAFYLCYLLVHPLLPSLAWALTLTVMAHPLHTRIARRVRNANLAAMFTVIIVAMVVVGPVIYVTQQLIIEIANSLEAIKSDEVQGNWRQVIEQNARLAAIFRLMATQIDLQDAFQMIESAVAERASSWLKGSAWALVQLLIYG